MSRPSVYCADYENRPPSCSGFPPPRSYRPPSCGYDRQDSPEEPHCNPDCLASCCLVPREEGQPDGVALPFEEGGLSCRHLTWPLELEEAVQARAKEVGKLIVARGQMCITALVGP